MAHAAAGCAASGLIGGERVRAGVLLAALAMLPGSLPALMRRSSLASFGPALGLMLPGSAIDHFCGLPQGKKASHPSYSVTSKFCLSPHRRIDAISTDRRAAHLQPEASLGE
jgi:hypothetical protein